MTGFYGEDGQHHCPAGHLTVYQMFSGGREWSCPVPCGDEGSYPEPVAGQAAPRALFLRTEAGRIELRRQMNEHLATLASPDGLVARVIELDAAMTTMEDEKMGDYHEAELATGRDEVLTVGADVMNGTGDVRLILAPSSDSIASVVVHVDASEAFELAELISQAAEDAAAARRATRRFNAEGETT